ncbi:hypothetical protein FQV37_2659 [Psychrobacter nivimaris]|uniref:Uncharacterized protein n=1 Tax=Psychrobacter nivimaris TaxID=281738 RepID=A0A6N7C2R8_9GAMM|nr:hypothetical protein FQV37_2659 [Psychrobacter nivimaris]
MFNLSNCPIINSIKAALHNKIVRLNAYKDVTGGNSKV